jgi:hypothetical protein
MTLPLHYGGFNKFSLQENALSADADGRADMQDGYLITSKFSDEALLGAKIGIYDVSLWDASVYK